MENKKTPLSINIIYYFTQFAFYLIIFATVAFGVMNIGLYTGLMDDAYQLQFILPIKFDVLEMGVIQTLKTDSKVEFVNAIAEINFKNSPLFIAQKFYWMINIAGLFGIYIIWLFKKFISNVKSEYIFEFQNIIFLKRIAYALTAFWAISTLHSYILYQYIMDHILFETINISNGMNFSFEHLQAALLIWVLAHIFSVGLELKEEQSLTI